MKITKHGHACLELEIGSEKALIDPGAYTEDLASLTGVVAVVITHKHDDHCFEPQIEAIKKANPKVQLFGTAEVKERLVDFEVTPVYHGDLYEVGAFKFEFYGDMHQEIHRSIPLIQNVGVFVNDTLFYPGDSYTRPDRTVKVLACPTSAPWLKIGDVMDFLEEVKPRKSFATHNALLSDKGHELNNSRVKLVTEAHGGEFTYLKIGQSLEV